MSKVQFVTNAGALAQRKRLLASEVRGNLRAAAKAHAEKMKVGAVQLSGGTLSPAAKARMGYPYALRFLPGAAGQADYIINIVTGDFARSWRTRVQETPRGWTITLINSSDHARFMMGTSKMRPRLILVQLDKAMRGELPARVRKVTRRAAQDNGGSPSLFLGVLYAVGVGVSSAAGGVEDAL